MPHDAPLPRIEDGDRGLPLVDDPDLPPRGRGECAGMLSHPPLETHFERLRIDGGHGVAVRIDDPYAIEIGFVHDRGGLRGLHLRRGMDHGLAHRKGPGDLPIAHRHDDEEVARPLIAVRGRWARVGLRRFTPVPEIPGEGQRFFVAGEHLEGDLPPHEGGCVLGEFAGDRLDRRSRGEDARKALLDGVAGVVADPPGRYHDLVGRLRFERLQRGEVHDPRLPAVAPRNPFAIEGLEDQCLGVDAAQVDPIREGEADAGGDRLVGGIGWRVDHVDPGGRRIGLDLVGDDPAAESVVVPEHHQVADHGGEIDVRLSGNVRFPHDLIALRVTDVDLEVARRVAHVDETVLEGEIPPLGILRGDRGHPGDVLDPSGIGDVVGHKAGEGLAAGDEDLVAVDERTVLRHPGKKGQGIEETRLGRIPDVEGRKPYPIGMRDDQQVSHGKEGACAEAADLEGSDPVDEAGRPHIARIDDVETISRSRDVDVGSLPEEPPDAEVVVTRLDAREAHVAQQDRVSHIAPVPEMDPEAPLRDGKEPLLGVMETDRMPLPSLRKEVRMDVDRMVRIGDVVEGEAPILGVAGEGDDEPAVVHRGRSMLIGHLWGTDCGDDLESFVGRVCLPRYPRPRFAGGGGRLRPARGEGETRIGRAPGKERQDEEEGEDFDDAEPEHHTSFGWVPEGSKRPEALRFGSFHERQIG